MSIEAFKESIITPLKKSIDFHRDIKLSQFRSREDVTRQWDISVGIELAHNHIESTYAAMALQKNDVPNDDFPKEVEIHHGEIMSPQN